MSGPTYTIGKGDIKHCLPPPNTLKVRDQVAARFDVVKKIGVACFSQRQNKKISTECNQFCSRTTTQMPEVWTHGRLTPQVQPA